MSTHILRFTVKGSLPSVVCWVRGHRKLLEECLKREHLWPKDQIPEPESSTLNHTLTLGAQGSQLSYIVSYPQHTCIRLSPHLQIMTTWGNLSSPHLVVSRYIPGIALVVRGPYAKVLQFRPLYLGNLG